MNKLAFRYGILGHQTVDQAAWRLMVPRKVLVKLIEDGLLVGVHRMIKTTKGKGKTQTKYFIPDWWVETAFGMRVDAIITDEPESFYDGWLFRAVMRIRSMPETKKKAALIGVTYRLANLWPVPPLWWLEIQPEALGIQDYGDIGEPFIRWMRFRQYMKI